MRLGFKWHSGGMFFKQVASLIRADIDSDHLTHSDSVPMLWQNSVHGKADGFS
jgi:hypothetical protein